MYFRADQKMQKIIKDLEGEEFRGPAAQHKSVVVDILKRGGARASLNIF